MNINWVKSLLIEQDTRESSRHCGLTPVQKQTSMSARDVHWLVTLDDLRCPDYYIKTVVFENKHFSFFQMDCLPLLLLLLAGLQVPEVLHLQVGPEWTPEASEGFPVSSSSGAVHLEVLVEVAHLRGAIRAVGAGIGFLASVAAKVFLKYGLVAGRVVAESATENREGLVRGGGARTRKLSRVREGLRQCLG